MTMASIEGEPPAVLQRKLTMDQKLKLAAAQRDSQKDKPQTNTAAATAAVANTAADITGGIAGALGGIKEGFGGALGDAKTAATRVNEPPIDQVNGIAEGTEPTSPKTPKSPGLGGAIMGGIGGGADLIKGGINGTVEGAKKGTGAAMEGAKDAATKAGDVGKGALEATLKTLGGKAAFQQVFASAIDKSDEGLAKAFKKVDADSSGNISAAEMSAHIASVYGGAMDESITTEMLKAADTDGDGEVSLDEFKAIMRAGPDVKPKAR